MAKKPNKTPETKPDAPRPEPEAETITQSAADAADEGDEGEGDEPEENEEEGAEGDNGEATDIDHLLDAARAGQADFKSQGARETDKVFFTRMLTVLLELPDAIFDSLPETAQAWANDSGEALNEGREVAAPDGFVSAFDPTAKGGRAKLSPAAAAGAKKAAKPIPPKRVSSKVIEVQRIVLANPGMKVDEIMAELARKNLVVHKGTVSTTRASMMLAIGVMKELGIWGGKKDAPAMKEAAE